MDQMLDQMSAGHLGEWEVMLEFWNVGEYPGYRADVIGATQASVLANIHRGRGQRALNASDFMPVFQAPSLDPDQELWDSLLAGSVPKRKGAPPTRKGHRERAADPKE